MVGERDRLASEAGREKTPQTSGSTANSTATSTPPTNTNTSRLRSIFSVLFTQSSRRSTEEASGGGGETTAAKGGEKQQAATKEPVSLKREISNSDIVLIRPSEAKCVEATIERIPTSEKALDSGDRQRSMPRSESRRQYPLKAMGRKLKGKLRRSASDDEDSADADSYVADLNDQLAAEKLRISSSDESGPEPEGGDAGEFKEPRESSPIDELWRTNGEYIPLTGTTPLKPQPPPRPPPPAFLIENRSKPKAPAVKRRQRSPTLEQFLSSHKIELSRKRGRSDDVAQNSSSDSSDESRSSCDSFSASVSSRLPAYHRAQFSRLIDPAPAYSSAALMSESDRRLYHWRKLAERSVTMWQVPIESSDDSDEADSLDLMNCHSPALVCYCSDDTSCSSVELIWSSQAPLQALELPMRPRAYNQASHRQSQAHQQRNEQPPPQKPYLRQASSVSPARSPLSADSTSRPNSKRTTPSPVQSKYPNNQQLMYLQAYTTNNNNNTSCSSLVSDYQSNSNSWRQRPAILELAKPSRARDRHISVADGSRRRISRAKSSSSHTQELKRNSVDCSLLRRQQNLTELSTAADKPEVQRSASRTSASDWVANPLFGRDSGAASDEVAKSIDSPEVGQKELSSPLRRSTSSDLLKLSGAPGSQRLKSFLARIKKFESSGERSDQLQGDVASGKKSLDEEQFDNFSLNESSAFEANERTKGHRWSLRLRTPFTADGLANRRRELGSHQPPAYLGQHLVNLDKRIKSNVSSLRSHLSDTGKRASVLADQLITSIKDTTREQLISAATGTSARDRYDTLPNSFAGQPSARFQSDGKQVLATDNGTTTKKARQFSLIYLHQQAQANGQPVITRQPTSSARPVSAIQVVSVAAEARRDEQAKAEQSMEQIIEVCERDSNGTVIEGEAPTEDVSVPTAAIKSHRTIGACERGRELRLESRQPQTARKRLRPRKARRQFNVAPTSDCDDEEQWKRHSDKLGPTGQYFKCAGQATSKLHVTY